MRHFFSKATALFLLGSTFFHGTSPLLSDFFAGLSYGYTTLNTNLTDDREKTTLKTSSHGPSLVFGYDFPLYGIQSAVELSFSPKGAKDKKTMGAASFELEQGASFTGSVSLGPDLPLLLFPYATLAISHVTTQLKYDYKSAGTTHSSHDKTGGYGFGYGLGVQKSFGPLSAALDYLYVSLPDLKHQLVASQRFIRATSIREHRFSLTITHSF